VTLADKSLDCISVATYLRSSLGKTGPFFTKGSSQQTTKQSSLSTSRNRHQFIKII